MPLKIHTTPCESGSRGLGLLWLSVLNLLCKRVHLSPSLVLEGKKSQVKPSFNLLF